MTDRDTINKKKIFLMIILSVTLISVITGAVFSYYSLMISQKEDATVLYTGTLQIDYIDGVYIKNPTLIPINSVSYNTYDKVYRNRFSISSSGTLDQTISITLDITKNEFQPGSLRYALYSSNGQLLANGRVENTGSINLTNNIFLAHDDTATYTLIIWLSENGYNQNSEMGKNITGKITAYAKQIKY